MNIYDIAQEAGISIAAVSRVLNNKGPVSAAGVLKALLCAGGWGSRIMTDGRYVRFSRIKQAADVVSRGREQGKDG